MKHLKRLPIALTIAGSDSGGGAGIQADLKTFAAIGVHGTSAITCLTAQNPKAVIGIQPCKTEMVTRQLKAVFAELRPAAAKTGMLFSTPIIRAVADFLEAQCFHSLVLDPVMVSTSGAVLLNPGSIRTLMDRLFPLACLVTPNLQEAELLCSRKLSSVEHLREAARDLHQRFGVAAPLKGGHLRGLKEAVDIFYDGKQELLLSAPFVRGVNTHGTGCTYSAAITAYLAKGSTLAAAVQKAKEFISQAIAQSQQTAEHSVLNTHWKSG
jgi:hydroxymethylpyrimidine/phosphomethylpyrimidine kinase